MESHKVLNLKKMMYNQIAIVPNEVTLFSLDQKGQCLNYKEQIGLFLFVVET